MALVTFQLGGGPWTPLVTSIPLSKILVAHLITGYLIVCYLFDYPLDLKAQSDANECCRQPTLGLDSRRGIFNIFLKTSRISVVLPASVRVRNTRLYPIYQFYFLGYLIFCDVEINFAYRWIISIVDLKRSEPYSKISEIERS